MKRARVELNVPDKSLEIHADGVTIGKEPMTVFFAYSPVINLGHYMYPQDRLRLSPELSIASVSFPPAIKPDVLFHHKCFYSTKHSSQAVCPIKPDVCPIASASIP